MASDFVKEYLEILLEDKCPITFTPNRLLNDAVEKCFWNFKKGSYWTYSIEDLFRICKEELSDKNVFHKCLELSKTVDDFAISIFYFKDHRFIDEILDSEMFIHPNGIERFSEVVSNQIKRYFSNRDNVACNFNSIDVNPRLGCVIGLNGKKINTYIDFERELDHELNHYFERMNFIEETDDLKNHSLNVNKNVIDFLIDYYEIDVENQTEFFNNVKTHFFDLIEFRSMCANVYHDIEKYNLKFNECRRNDFYSYVDSFNISNVPTELRQSVIFSWVVKNISKNRWIILKEAIDSAFKIRHSKIEKNIFEIKKLAKKFFE